MTFTLLPAVDVAGGRAVRPRQGRVEIGTTSVDPLHAALSLQAEGAEWIHLVDLDAAFGRGSNAELLEAVIGELDIPVELAGGVTDGASLDRALASGCARVVLGTAALADPRWCERSIAVHGQRLAVGLDVRILDEADGSQRHRLAARGSSPATNDVGDLWETVAWLDRVGCPRYVVTDVNRDGMLDGPNVELYRAITRTTTTPLLASGGISSIEDLMVLANENVLADEMGGESNIEGSIVGKALHAGRFSLTEALEAMRQI